MGLKGGPQCGSTYVSENIEEERCEDLRLNKTGVVEGFHRSLHKAGRISKKCGMGVGGGCYMT